MAEWADPSTFSSIWERAVAEHSADTFLLFEGPTGHVANWTYEEFDTLVRRVATLLTDNGVTEGSSVHLALTNCPTFVAVWLATNRLGAWIVPSDPMGPTPELADHIDRTLPAIGFCSTTRADVYRPATTSKMTVIEINESDVDFTDFPTSEFKNWVTPSLTSRAAVMFTSGTTGRPKGVEITQANYAFAGKIMAEAADLSSSDRQLVVLPLFHGNAQYYSFASAIWTGASVSLIHTFSASRFIAQAARHGATCASLFAAPIRMILARGAPVEGLQLRLCWFAQNLAEDQYKTIATWLGCELRQLYGMTETIPAVLCNKSASRSADSMGFVTPGCDVSIQDASGITVPPGTVGEIVVGGVTGVTLFAGYLDDPQTTSVSFRNGWFLTGDRAWRDQTGRFFFDGRHSDVLKVAGENVSTVEIEAVLTSHPDILEAAVVGAPDDIRDQVPVAFIVAKNPLTPPPIEDLQRWCSKRLAKAKRPRDIKLVKELPRTSVGKIKKFELNESVRS